MNFLTFAFVASTAIVVASDSNQERNDKDISSDSPSSPAPPSPLALPIIPSSDETATKTDMTNTTTSTSSEFETSTDTTTSAAISTIVTTSPSPRMRDAMRAKLRTLGNKIESGYEKAKDSVEDTARKTKDVVKSGYHHAKDDLKRGYRRAKAKVKGGYYRTKMDILYHGARYMVDYGFSLKSFAELMANHQLSDTDNKTIHDAIRAFMSPLKTYQAAQSKVAEEMLSSSLQEMLRIVSSKPVGSVLEEGDWKEGKIFTQVFRRFDVDSVLENRDALLQMNSGDSNLLQEKEYHEKAMNYFKGIDPHSWRFRKYISRDLDWDQFERRYFEVVTKLLVADPKIHVRARKYLAQFMFTGDPREAKFQSLLKEAGANNQNVKKDKPSQERVAPVVISDATSNKAVLYPIMISSLLLFLL